MFSIFFIVVRNVGCVFIVFIVCLCIVIIIQVNIFISVVSVFVFFCCVGCWRCISLWFMLGVSFIVVYFVGLFFFFYCGFGSIVVQLLLFRFYGVLSVVFVVRKWVQLFDCRYMRWFMQLLGLERFWLRSFLFFEFYGLFVYQLFFQQFLEVLLQYFLWFLFVVGVQSVVSVRSCLVQRCYCRCIGVFIQVSGYIYVQIVVKCFVRVFI